MDSSSNNSGANSKKIDSKVIYRNLLRHFLQKLISGLGFSKIDDKSKIFIKIIVKDGDGVDIDDVPNKQSFCTAP